MASLVGVVPCIGVGVTSLVGVASRVSLTGAGVVSCVGVVSRIGVGVASRMDPGEVGVVSLMGVAGVGVAGMPGDFSLLILPIAVLLEGSAHLVTTGRSLLSSSWFLVMTGRCDKVWSTCNKSHDQT